MKKICLFIISLLLNILLIVSIGLSNEKRDTYFIIQNSNVKIFLLPFIEMFLLAIHYIFCHTLPLYIFRKDKKMFNVFRIIRGFYLFVSFGLLVNLIVNNDIFTMSPYNSTFYIVILFYLLYMFIAVPIIENNVYKDLDLGVYFRDLKDNTIYSSLMIILIMIFNSFLYIFVYLEKIVLLWDLLVLLFQWFYFLSIAHLVHHYHILIFHTNIKIKEIIII